MKTVLNKLMPFKNLLPKKYCLRQLPQISSPYRSLSTHKPRQQFGFFSQFKKIKFRDLHKLMEKEKYEEGAELTEQYIKQKEKEFGKDYEGIENDLLLLGDFYKLSYFQDSIEKSIPLYLRAYEISAQRENLHIQAGALKNLFFIWGVFQEVPDIRQKFEDFNNLLEQKKDDFPIEKRCQFISPYCIILREQGDTSVKLLANTLPELEERFLNLQQEKMEEQKDEQNQNKQEINIELFEVIMCLSKAYRELSEQSIYQRDFKQLMVYLDKSTKMLSKQIEMPDWLERIIVFQTKETLHYFYMITNQVKQVKANIDSLETYNLDKDDASYFPLLMRNLEYYLLVKDLKSAQKEVMQAFVLSQQQSLLGQNIIQMFDLLSQEQIKLFELDFLQLMCKYYMLNNDTVKADETIEVCLELLDKLGNRPFKVIKIKSLESEVYMHKGDSKRAQQIVNECITKYTPVLGKDCEQLRRLELLYFNYLFKQKDVVLQTSQINSIRDRVNTIFEHLKAIGTYGLESDKFIQEFLDQKANEKTL